MNLGLSLIAAIICSVSLAGANVVKKASDNPSFSLSKEPVFKTTEIGRRWTLDYVRMFTAEFTIQVKGNVIFDRNNSFIVDVIDYNTGKLILSKPAIIRRPQESGKNKKQLHVNSHQGQNIVAVVDHKMGQEFEEGTKYIVRISMVSWQGLQEPRNHTVVIDKKDDSFPLRAFALRSY